MNEFFAMGGYGVFVWPAYGMTALLMIGLLVASVRTMRANAKMLDTLREQARAHGQPAEDEDGV